MINDKEFKILKDKVECLDEQMSNTVSTAGGRVGPITSPGSGIYPKSATNCGCGNNNVIVNSLHTDDNCNDSRTDDRSDSDNGLGLDMVGNKPKNKLVSFGLCGNNSFGQMLSDKIWKYKADFECNNGLNLGANSFDDINSSKEAYIALSNNKIYYTTNGGNYWEDIIPDCLNLNSLPDYEISSDIGQTNIYISEYYYDKFSDMKRPLDIPAMTAEGGMNNCSCNKNDLYGLPVINAQSSYSGMVGKLLTINVSVDHTSHCNILMINKDPKLEAGEFVDHGDNTATFTWTPSDSASGEMVGGDSSTLKYEDEGIYPFQFLAQESPNVHEYGLSCMSTKISIVTPNEKPHIYIPAIDALDHTDIKVPVFLYGFTDLGKIVIELNTVDTAMRYKGLSDNTYGFDDHYIPYDADTQSDPEVGQPEETSNKGTIILIKKDNSCSSSINVDGLAFYLEFELNLDNKSFYDENNNLIHYMYTTISLNKENLAIYDNEGTGTLIVTGDMPLTSLNNVKFIQAICLGTSGMTGSEQYSMLYLGLIDNCYIILNNIIGSNNWTGYTKFGKAHSVTYTGASFCYVANYNTVNDSYDVNSHLIGNGELIDSIVVSENVSENYILTDILNIEKRYFNITSYDNKLYVYGKFIVSGVMCNVASTGNAMTSEFSCVYDKFAYGYCTNLVVNGNGIYMVKNMD